ncbi:hypothetical protein BDF20DRAFT_799223, partial [Mycotypha africana]|uniref:uncharacterized protein n=1 Tax=Mycotypha africana TaxID=64632 RepID=UPI002300639D
MDISKVFQCRNISTTCEHISKYCELYINSSLNPSSHNVRSFHTFFPTLLVYIFGSPNVRGWAQIETLDHEDEAIKKLLSVKGHFFQALIKLSQFPEYSYDLVTDALPADVKRLLSTGAIHILPNVYKNCTYLSTSAINKSVDIKAAATRQSTLLAPFGGERRIKFNMIQFYLYYFASVATWSPQPVINTNPTNIPNTSNQPNQSVSTSALYSRFSNNSPSVNNTPNPTRAVSYGVYSPVLEEYMSELIPIGIREDFPPIIQSFFFDVLMELFIRVTYVPVPYQALSSDLLFFITAFVKFIVRHDLRQYDDDYLSVIDLWAVWAAPWKFGVTPRSSEKYDYMPIQHGWAAFILDNLPFYLHHTDIFLQRASTFIYNGTIRGQLRILYRIINVIKANGLLEFLGYIEKAIERLQMGSSAIDSGGNSSTNYFKQLSMIAYGTENMDSIVCQKLKAAYDFSIQVENSNWKPKGLFTNDIQPRSEALLKTVGSV